MLSAPSFPLLCFQFPVDLYPSSCRHLPLKRCPAGAGYPLGLPDAELLHRPLLLHRPAGQFLQQNQLGELFLAGYKAK